MTQQSPGNVLVIHIVAHIRGRFTSVFSISDVKNLILAQKVQSYRKFLVCTHINIVPTFRRRHARPLQLCQISRDEGMCAIA